MACFQWDRSINTRAGTVGFNRQIAVKLAQALPHSPDAYSGAGRLNLSKSLRGHPCSLVLNRHADAFCFPRDFYLSGFASRVTMNVRQTLLHQSEYQNLHFRRKSSKVAGNPQVDLQAAAFPKTLYVPKKWSNLLAPPSKLARYFFPS